MNKINLLAGIPDDSNREYLPEFIKDSEIVVNENGNNSLVYPKRLRERKEKLVDDQEDIWYEYVPASYDPSKKTPLLFSMHGGLMTGWGQAVYTSWTHIAEREGFICLFPNAQKRRFWTIECEEALYEELSKPNPIGIYMNPVPDRAKNHDILVIFALIRKMKECYCIDNERIYMQGMSLGNAMTTMMARYYGNQFAAMSGSAGPATIGLLFDQNGYPLNEAGALPVMQTRMELDQSPPGSKEDSFEVVARNRNYWLIINECMELPEIKVEGENNFAFYRGKKADYIFRDVKNRDHGQTFDDAELVWDYLFSGTRRKVDGTIEYSVPLIQRKGDTVNLAVGAGCSYLWVNNQKQKLAGKSFLWKKLKYHGLNGDTIERGSYLMVPVRNLAEASDASYEEVEGKVEVVMKDGKILQFARGCFGCTVNNRIQDMFCEAVERDDILFVSAEWFCAQICGLHFSRNISTMYASDHYGELSSHMERLLLDILK